MGVSVESLKLALEMERLRQERVERDVDLKAREWVGANGVNKDLSLFKTEEFWWEKEWKIGEYMGVLADAVGGSVRREKHENGSKYVVVLGMRQGKLDSKWKEFLGTESQICLEDRVEVVFGVSKWGGGEYLGVWWNFWVWEKQAGSDVYGLSPQSVLAEGRMSVELEPNSRQKVFWGVEEQLVRIYGKCLQIKKIKG